MIGWGACFMEEGAWSEGLCRAHIVARPAFAVCPEVDEIQAGGAVKVP